MSDLYMQVQKLASEHPELRSYLVPLLQKQGGKDKKEVSSGDIKEGLMNLGDGATLLSRTVKTDPVTKDDKVLIAAVKAAYHAWEKVNELITDGYII